MGEGGVKVKQELVLGLDVFQVVCECCAIFSGMAIQFLLCLQRSSGGRGLLALGSGL